MGIEAKPDLLSQVAGTLRNAGTDLDASASTPPQPQAGDITELLSATLQVLCEGVGNVAASAGGLGDAVAEGRAEYDAIDYDQALNVKSAQSGG
ncbi:hypothetical protein E1202_04490 [Saccharopolyspora karakumensis]|uniref:Excreted virulence factor EspC, type VII ESX diderm n=1 Tax=Saccharopolyspora karakumensis TaxID=2530386 RepID=A0A4R5C1S0_9PSEU|nr:hypothetical protein [Saccharopolyspora karakumensis]TDD91993.1 hypothetical protein E1202_04490 [Saccharopolyspora karakumensis]